MTDTATRAAISITTLAPERDGVAATIIPPDVLANARSDAETDVYGLTVDGELAAVYVLRKVTLMNEIACLAVAEGHRRHGHGRACLYDALLRSGRRPLVVETDDDAVGFYRACGFKLVGKRKRPDGVTRYRLGWHAPLPKPAGAESQGVCS